MACGAHSPDCFEYRVAPAAGLDCERGIAEKRAEEYARIEKKKKKERKRKREGE